MLLSFLQKCPEEVNHHFPLCDPVSHRSAPLMQTCSFEVLKRKKKLYYLISSFALVSYWGGGSWRPAYHHIKQQHRRKWEKGKGKSVVRTKKLDMEQSQWSQHKLLLAYVMDFIFEFNNLNVLNRCIVTEVPNKYNLLLLPLLLLLLLLII